MTGKSGGITRRSPSAGVDGVRERAFCCFTIQSSATAVVSVHDTTLKPVRINTSRIASEESRKLMSGPRAHGTGKIRGPSVAKDYVMDREHSARFEHAKDLTVEASPVAMFIATCCVHA